MDRLAGTVPSQAPLRNSIMTSLRMRFGRKTLGELRDRYLEVLANGKVTTATQLNYQSYFRHLLRILGDMPIVDFTHDRLQDYVNQRGLQGRIDNVGE